LGDCQVSTVQALLDKAPDLQVKDSLSRWVARLGGCSEVLALVDRPRSIR